MATDKKISELPVASAISSNDTSVLVKNGVDYQFAFNTLLQFISSELSVGATITFGTSIPSNSVGKNGDVFVNTNSGSFAQKITGIWAVVYTLPSGNTPDGTVLYGNNNPGSAIGKNNDTYVNTVSGIFYKKSADVWNQVFSMQTGPPGSAGTPGANGTSGTNGNTVLNGNHTPSNLTDGVNGDFYINTITYDIFGPKTDGIWGPATSLIPDGVQAPSLITYESGELLPITIDYSEFSQHGSYPDIMVKLATGKIITSQAEIDTGTVYPPISIVINANDDGSGNLASDIIIIIKD
jgi:hypothetical protein